MAVSKIVRKLKNGKTKRSYRAEVFNCGVKIADRVFPTETAARVWHDKQKSKVAKGYALTKSFDECFTEYLQGPFLCLGKSTQQAKESRLKYLIDCPLSSINLEDMSPRHISDWLIWLSKQPMGKRRESFHEELALLNTVLTWYQETQDPSFVIPILKRHRTKDIYFKEISPRRPDYYMKPEEVRRWLEALSARRDRTYFYLGDLMVHTGLRVGEAAGLCWDAVDLESSRPCLRVIRTLGWEKNGRPYFKNQAKNDSSIRIVSLPKSIAQELRSIKEAGTFPVSGDVETVFPVFVDRKKRALPYSRARYHFNKAFEKAGLDWSATHISRHTFATLSLKATRDLSSVQAAMGHASQSQTQQYAKIIALDFGDQMERTAALIAGENSNHSQNHSQVGGEAKTPLQIRGL